MKKCVKIICTGATGGIKEGFLPEFIQLRARELGLEGVAQLQVDGGASMTVVGMKEQVDDFIDLVHREAQAWKVAAIEVEPMIKDRDYRGIFRVIE